jgi:hypothetical protein
MTTRECYTALRAKFPGAYISINSDLVADRAFKGGPTPAPKLEYSIFVSRNYDNTHTLSCYRRATMESALNAILADAEKNPSANIDAHDADLAEVEAICAAGNFPMLSPLP